MERLFDITYKLRYCETSDWGNEILKATNERDALNLFAKSRRISIKKYEKAEDWQWEEGVWSANFHGISEVKEIKCPHCKGTGTIHI